jgi:hypothetical protein
MPTHTIITVYQTPGGSIQGSVTVTDDTEVNIDVTLEDATPVTWTGSILTANIKSLCVMCTGAATVKVNGSGGAALFGGLAANVPKVYPDASTAAAALTTNVTSLYITGPAGGATFSLRAVLSNVP